MARRSSKARRRPKARSQGVLELHAEGFGFVKTAEGEFFIPSSKINGAFPGDLVEVSPMSFHGNRPKRSYISSRKPTARVTKVLMRSSDTLIGRYEVAEPFGVVVPEDARIPYDIFTLRRDAPTVKDGDMVEVRIIEFPSRNTAATGTVVRVLGSEDDKDIAIDLIVAEHQFETTFSKAALEEADACSLDIEEALLSGYRDVRDEFIFTIDPADARDFDDAVSIERIDESTYRLGIHIADVSRFVGWSSSLDLDARRRATSVYLVDRVLPMLPEKLSNDLCSLVPNQSRCAVSVDVVITAQGRVVFYDVFPSVIRSSARLSYDQAQTLLDAYALQLSPEETLRKVRSCDVAQGAIEISSATLEQLKERIGMLDMLAKTLFALRRKNGCIDFERIEAKVQLDEEKCPRAITYRAKTDATNLIEESMILANHLVAEWLIDKGKPCVFRVHGAPDSEDLRALYDILQEFSMFKDIDKRLFCAGDPQTLQEVLSRVKGLPTQELVNTLLLRSMRRAQYQVEVDPHYGLALDTYCHFTSPIRRYPDLLVHRMIKEVHFGRQETSEAQKNALSWLADHSSTMERKAEKAARQSQLVKIVEYMQDYIGQTFTGVISRVSTFGITVKLENTASGMLSVEDLGDEYFSYDQRRQVLRGISSGKVYRLGQRIEVVLVDAHPKQRTLLFTLASY